MKKLFWTDVILHILIIQGIYKTKHLTYPKNYENQKKGGYSYGVESKRKFTTYQLEFTRR
jgi:hypothetical protein